MKSRKLYAIETEHGRIYVSRSEFQDVRERYNGAYGNMFPGFAWVEETEDKTTVGRSVRL
jgi:hypothetical protein